MAYHTGIYLLLFLPAVLLLYQLTPKKSRWITLLAAGYLFFWICSGKLVLYLLGTTLFTHYIAVWISWIKTKCNDETAGMQRTEAGTIKKAYKKKEKAILVFGICVLLGILAYLKYYNFFIQNVNVLLAQGGSSLALGTKQMLIPVGISFYTLQAIGYMADVYWEKVEVFRHPGKIALFLGFFPQIMEGPISSYAQTADTLFEGNPLTMENLAQGSVRIFWGLFKKLLIADRLYLLVDVIFNNYQYHYGEMIVIVAIAYTTQLYMEFSGCMDIIIGSGKMFGVTLPENFRQPFFSKSAAEFWRRWHITLGVWFKTYVFYPVSVSGIVNKWNKFGKKHCGKYLTKLGISALCLFPVWICNGLWHGARWSYIFYGMYYFVILLAEVAVEPLRDNILEICHLDKKALPYRILQTLKTWLIIFTGELFFRANGLQAGMSMFFSIFKGNNIQSFENIVARQEEIRGILMSVGLDRLDYFVVIAGCIVVAVVGIIKEKKLLGEEGIQKLWLPVRWTLYYALIFAVLILGAYGMGYQQVDMIYAGF